MGRIPAQAVLRFVERLEQGGVCMHGFELRADGRIEAEGYYAPFRKGEIHRMYSVSKSMVSLAVGMLQAEGKLSLGDHIVDYFPDKIDGSVDPRLARLTIRDMLRMATCYEKTTYREGIDENWARSFFNTPPTHEPGTMFFYDTSSSQVLGELCERLSGKGMLAFLEERLFAPLGATDEKRWLTDPSGVAQGGTGLMMSLRDLAKVAQCVMDGGHGLIPQAYLAEATAQQIETGWQGNPEERYGYGYQFWRTRHGYCMYGMGGQLAVFCPDEGVLLCTIADTRLDSYGLQKLYDAFFEEILPHVDEASDKQAEEALARRLAGLRVAGVAHHDAPWDARSRVYRMAGNAAGLVELRVEESAVALVWEDGEQRFAWERFGELAHGLFPGTDEPCLVSAGLTRDGALNVRCQLTHTAPSGFELLVCEKGGTVSLRMKKASGPQVTRYGGLFFGTEA